MAANILEQIVAHQRELLAAQERACPAAELLARIADLPATRSFGDALSTPGQTALIAEVKRASPSKGLIRADFEPVAIATGYASAGAACLSVLTEERWFQGSPDYLRAIRAAVDLPLLRKDFTLSRYHLLQARAWGADAALLIVAILEPPLLAELLTEAAALGLTALVEVHTAEELDVALAAGARLVGINNRDLRVFRTDLSTTLELLPRVPAGVSVVSESGINTPDDVRHLRAAGVAAVLVGEALMREHDFVAKTRELARAGRN